MLNNARHPDMKRMGTKKVVVVGAGIAGLAAAHYLRKRGLEVEILEREAVAGGSVRSALRDERYLVEFGPNAFLASAEPIQKLARELSIDPLIVGSDELSRHRYIHRGGRTHQLPAGPLSFLRSGLLSPLGKARLMAEPFVRSSSAPGETLAAFVKRRAGAEVLDALVDPFVSGVWAGDAGELEVASVFPKIVEVERECGSVLRGMKKLAGGVRKRGLLSFRWGMGTLTARLEEELRSRLRLGARVQGLARTGADSRRWRVKLADASAAVDADAVLVAAPAHAAAKLLLPHDAKLFPALAAIPYASLAVVHTAHREADVPTKPDGFGVLIPRSEGIRMLGTIFSSAIFPGRCPRGEVLLTNFIGGATDAGLVDLADEEVVGEVRAGLRATMGIEQAPKFVAFKRWGQAIPQYTVGHRDRIATIREQLAGHPGLFLTGAYFDGVSVSDTIAHARSVVDDIVAYLR